MDNVHFLIGVDDSAPSDSIQTGEIAWLKQAVEFAREAREKGISVSMQYDAAPGELRDRVARGLCRQAVYLSSEGMQGFGDKAAEGGDR